MTSKPESAWVTVRCHEIALAEKTPELLQDFARPYSQLYDLAVQVPALAVGGIPDQSLEVGAALYKRALTDYRAVWLLLSAGYHSQAATVASSLWEHALAAEAVLESPENARHFEDQWTEKMKWSTAGIAAFSATALEAEAKLESQIAAQHAHGAYAMLCKIKHPTMASVGFDTGSTWDGGRWSMEARPDQRPEALNIASWVLSASMSRMHGATYALATKASAIGTPKPWAPIFWTKLTEVAEAHGALRSKHAGPLPFGLSMKDMAKYKAITKATKATEKDADQPPPATGP